MSTKALKGLTLIGVAGLMIWVAGVASARTQANLYGVNALVSDSAAAPATGDGRVARQRLGPDRGADDAVVGRQQRYEHIDALQRRRRESRRSRSRWPGAPTGAVFNGHADDFVVSQNGKSGAARFLFCDRKRQRSPGWSPSVNANTPQSSEQTARGSGAIYKGLAVANDKLCTRRTSTTRRVDVFDKSFNARPGRFHRYPRSRRASRRSASRRSGGNIFVTYAQQDAAKKDDVAAPGQGYVDEFTPDGALIAQVVNSGKKNAPLNAAWGLALAPADFGAFARRPARGELRKRPDQRLHAARLRSGSTRASCRRSDGNPIAARRTLGDRVRQRRRRGSDEHALLPLRSLRREARPLRIDRRKLIELRT